MVKPNDVGCARSGFAKGRIYVVEYAAVIISQQESVTIFDDVDRAPVDRFLLQRQETTQEVLWWGTFSELNKRIALAYMHEAGTVHCDQIAIFDVLPWAIRIDIHET